MPEDISEGAAIRQQISLLTNQLKAVLICLVLGTVLIYYFSNPESHSPFDYTLRMAGQFLHGQLGFSEQLPSWLNEMVPFEGHYYSVFPLGTILTMLPAAILKAAGIIDDNPSAMLVAIVAGLICLFLFLLTFRYNMTLGRRVLTVIVTIFGTWMWCNLTMAGAWQLTLGFAILGQLGALYFILIKQKPIIAGCFFALAFGNRTEIVLVAPVFIYLLTRIPASDTKCVDNKWIKTVKFCALPFILGVMTMAYNYARFHSAFDFGYARIPGILNEPWYRHGIFSLTAIPLNVKEMLLTGWKPLEKFPYLVPTGFGGSIFLSSPFLFLLFRKGAIDSRLKISAWISILLLTFLLWCHGNPGGWQFSYRYAMVLLPWAFLILLENSPKKIMTYEKVLFACSIIINAYATYLFFWTKHVTP